MAYHASPLEQLFALGIPTEFHAYIGLPHGFGLSTGTVAEGWINDAIRFWEHQSSVTGIRQTKTSSPKACTIYSPNGPRRDKIQRCVNIINGKKIIK